MADLEEIAKRNAEIDAEIAQFHQERERQAMQEFLAVPSYVERFSQAKQSQEAM
jgi:hypothetical protein